MTEEINATTTEEVTETPVEAEIAAPTEVTEATPEAAIDPTEAPTLEMPAAEAAEPAPEASAETELTAEAAPEPAAEAAVPAPEASAEAAEPAAEAAPEPAAEAAAPAPEANAEAAPQAAAVATPHSIGDLQPGMEVTGTVKRIELFGAFVDIGVGKDGLLHISQLGKPDVRNVEDVVQSGQTLNLYVMRVDKEQGRIALSMNKPVGVSWDHLKIGMEVTGTVVKLESYGAFLDFGAERPGMIHVSEMASGYVKSPSEVVSMGETVTAQIIKLDRKKKRIDLSLKAMVEEEAKASAASIMDEPQEYVPTAMELALRRAMKDDDPAFEYSDRRRSDRAERRARKQEREREDIFERTLKHHRGN